MAIYFYSLFHFFLKPKNMAKRQNHRRSESPKIRFKAVEGLTGCQKLCICGGVAAAKTNKSKMYGSHASAV
jgi:ligand-binding sensor protein